MSDPRETPFNGRVAHQSLRGKVTAERFTEGELRRVAVPVCDLFRAPEPGRLERQLPFGAGFIVLEEAGGWCFGMAETSGYCGYVAAGDLGDGPAPTHRVSARMTLVFAEPNIKTPKPLALSLGARVCVTGHEGRFAAIPEGFVPAGHLAALDAPESDPVAVAARLLGTAYLWGGNSAFGVDCSGLVQLALQACNIACPGDSDLQARDLGRHLPEGTTPERGDLMFWKGHVAWVADPDTLLHANGYHMAVAYEPLAGAIARVKAQGDGPVIAHVRL